MVSFDPCWLIVIRALCFRVEFNYRRVLFGLCTYGYILAIRSECVDNYEKFISYLDCTQSTCGDIFRGQYACNRLVLDISQPEQPHFSVCIN